MQAETNSPFSGIVSLGALEIQHPVTRGSKWGGLIGAVIALLGAEAVSKARAPHSRSA